MPDDILGVHELATLAGVLPRTLSAYVSRGQCPTPDYVLRCGPIWKRATAEAWIAKRDARLLAAGRNTLGFCPRCGRRRG